MHSQREGIDVRKREALHGGLLSEYIGWGPGLGGYLKIEKPSFSCLLPTYGCMYVTWVNQGGEFSI